VASDDPFEYLRRIQRLLDQFQPILRDYERVQRQIRKLAPPTPLLEAAREYEGIQSRILETTKFVASIESLSEAMRPISFALQTLPGTTGLEKAARDFAAINDAIRRATLIADIDLSAPSEEADVPLTPERAESQLVELVSPEVMADLQRVEFAPLVLLDRALRDPDLMHSLEARDFEKFIAALVDQLGFEDVVLTPRSGDDGRDIVATLRVHGMSILCAFECKRYAKDRAVGPDIARALLGTITQSSTRAAKGILVTTSYFSPSVRRMILTEPSLDGRDFDGIVEWLRDYGQKRRR
jgi:hypothetical protein